MNKQHKVLIANRGEIAVRIIQACVKLGLDFVCVHTAEDACSGHVALAREIGGEKSLYRISSYHDANELLSVADESGATAVHPGYGFFAEDFRFARRVTERERPLVFLGPSWRVIRDLGDKINTKRLARSLGVPTVPGSDRPIYDELEAEKIARSLFDFQMQQGLFGEESLLHLKVEERTRNLFGLKLVVNGTVGTGHRGHAERTRQTLGVDFVAEIANDAPGRPEKHQRTLALGHSAGETEILGKEAVAGMNGRGAGFVGHAQKLVGIVIGRNAIQALFAADLAGQSHMTGTGVFRGMNAHEVEPELYACLNDANRDFAAVGNKHFMLFIHAISLLQRGKGHKTMINVTKRQSDPLLPPCPAHDATGAARPPTPENLREPGLPAADAAAICGAIIPCKRKESTPPSLMSFYLRIKGSTATDRKSRSG